MHSSGRVRERQPYDGGEPIAFSKTPAFTSSIDDALGIPQQKQAGRGAYITLGIGIVLTGGLVYACLTGDNSERFSMEALQAETTAAAAPTATGTSVVPTPAPSSQPQSK